MSRWIPFRFAILLASMGAGLATVAWPSAADAASDQLPALVVAGRETFDLFGVPAGVQTGAVLLNKLQLSATLRGDRLGLSGWSIHAQIFRYDGGSLSRRLGDIQTADNIEAMPVTRLFEAYLARIWRGPDSSVAVRLGLIDLNNQFDSIDPASLMLNSSHGIAPDLSRSGVDGPSIYPVTAAGSTVTWVDSGAWTFRLGLFDGVAGRPGKPHAFVSERLNPSDGLFLIAQSDRRIGKTGRLEAGAWAYTAPRPAVDGRRGNDHGIYASYEASTRLLPRVEFWLRAGVSNGAVQPIAAYLGGGMVQQGTIRGRPDDRLGIAIAHAVIGDTASDAFGLSHAETSFELTYQVKLSNRFVIQPDLDYIRHPAGVAGAPDSLGVGIRFVYAGAYPTRMEASDPGDPTVPPDGAAPAGN